MTSLGPCVADSPLSTLQQEEEVLIQSEATALFVRKCDSKVSPEMPEHQTTALSPALALPKP